MKRMIDWMYVVLVLILASLGHSGIARAVEPAELEVQKTWFLIGYEYGEATKPKEIQNIIDLLCEASAEELVPLFEKWAKGEVKKAAVRGPLMAFVASKKGLLVFSACRLGEWVRALENAHFRSFVGILFNDEQMFWKAVEDIMILMAQAQEFVDALSQYAPAEVIQTLTDISGARHDLTFVPIFVAVGGDLPPEKLEEIAEKIAEAFGNVLLNLPDWVEAIKTAYGVK